MAVAQVALPPKLIPVFTGPAEVRGAYGGRGSGKTRSFAKMAAIKALMWAAEGRDGVVVCARQFMNSIDDSSMAEVKMAINDEPWLAQHFEIGEKFIRTKNRKVSFVFAGLARNINSLKSKARVLLCWVDEAEEVPEKAWETLIPTIREEGSELWVTWNPKRRASATDKRFRQSHAAANDPSYKVIELNWRDNPRFTAKLEKQRTDWLRDNADSYDHVWEGGYASSTRGAYFVKQITAAKAEGRLALHAGDALRIPVDPLMRRRVFVDIGGTGARADAFAMWVAQFVGLEVRIIDYYEQVGQPIGAHLTWLHERGHRPGVTDIWLPHDGATHDRVFAVSYESALNDAGYEVTVVPNQGRGAAISRINAARRMFPACRFDSEGTSAGVEALAWYHEKWDEERDIGLGPDHDWASHGSDAFGLMGVVYEDAARPSSTGETPPRASSSANRSRWRRGSAMSA